MKLFHSFYLLLACLSLSGCMGRSGQPPTSSGASLPRPADVMRVGDKVTIRLEGVPDNGYISEIQIPESGEITVPLLTQSFRATGRTTGALAAEISEAYKSQKIYSTPAVTVLPEERYVNVGGDVRSPTRVLYTPDLTLLSAINACGGFTDYAKRNSVRILRGNQVFYVNAVTAGTTPGQDPPLFPGDQITVPRTMF